MKNEALMELDGLVGEWNLTLSDASFLESREAEVHGSARIEWLGEAFLVMLSDAWDLAIGRSDANGQYTALYHDPRGVSRVFEMTFSAGKWELLREDPDFHQRLSAVVERDRITGRWDASEDAGQTWRKDFDIVFERKG
jgi:hypothetical protein